MRPRGEGSSVSSEEFDPREAARVFGQRKYLSRFML